MKTRTKIILGIIALIAVGSFWKEDSKPEDNPSAIQQSITTDEEEELSGSPIIKVNIDKNTMQIYNELIEQGD